MPKKSQKRTILGLDLGANSVGWALIETESGKDARILGMGSRIFPAGVEGTVQDIERGKDKPSGEARRDARQSRRQLERRANRTSDLAHTLQSLGLLPEGSIESEPARHEFFKDLDGTIYKAHESSSNGNGSLNQLPYYLRKRGLDNKLTPHELGRALYHLGQRRGFLSNRKAQKKDEEEGVVKKDISLLTQRMSERGARTLGEYLADLDPHETRLRQRWTSRDMYKDEFKAVWAVQAQDHPDLLTDEVREKVFEVMFHQRKLKSQKHLVGKCSVLPTKRRVPWALLDAQRFRILQKINDMIIIDEDGRERPLDPEQRQKALDMLDHQKNAKFTAIRKALKCAKTDKLNFERGGETKMPGNRSACDFRGIFGERWDGFSREEQDQLVEDVLSFEKDHALATRGINRWGLVHEEAQKLGELQLEPGYCSLSRKALKELLSLMEDGVQFATAKKQLFGDEEYRFKTQYLPIVDEAPFELRNPSVHRTLTQVGKVVNAIIKKYGRPDQIRLELARELKQPRKQRTEMWKKKPEEPSHACVNNRAVD